MATPETIVRQKSAGSPRCRWVSTLPAALGVVAALTLLSACGSGTPDLSAQVTAAPVTNAPPPSPTASVIGYTGAAVTVPVPPGKIGVTITAIGGGGGLSVDKERDVEDGSLGALVSGYIPVPAGDQLIVSVGEQGDNIKADGVRALRGWGAWAATAATEALITMVGFEVGHRNLLGRRQRTTG
jgi:hypothetical protein